MRQDGRRRLGVLDALAALLAVNRDQPVAVLPGHAPRTVEERLPHLAGAGLLPGSVLRERQVA